MHVIMCPCFLLGANEPIDMEKFQEPSFIWMPRAVVIKMNGELQKNVYSRTFYHIQEARLQPDTEGKLII